MAIRYLYLIRHGQYSNVQETDDRGGGLTDTGRQQADLVAESLTRFPLKAVYCSSMRRAFETAERIAVRHGLAPHSFDLLREVVPSVPTSDDAPPGMHFPKMSDTQIARERDMADRAFTRFFQPVPEEDDDIHEALVCHGNIIRYFVCRVLGAPGELWWKMETNHCGISRCSIEDGLFRLISLNDTGHLPLDLQLFM